MSEKPVSAGTNCGNSFNALSTEKSVRFSRISAPMVRIGEFASMSLRTMRVPVTCTSSSTSGSFLAGVVASCAMAPGNMPTSAVAPRMAATAKRTGTGL